MFAPLFHWKSVVSAASISLILVASANARQDSDRRSELGLRQKLVERRMSELENKLTVIADRLREKEPERAALLVAAYQQSKELLITRKMAEVSELFDKKDYAGADQKLNEVIENLESLIRILVAQKEPPLSKEQEMELLEQWKEKIQEQIKEQNQQRRETEKVADKEKAIGDLEAQIKKLEGLIDKQKEVIEATSQNQGAGLRALDQIADKQFEVRQATEALNQELAGQNSAAKKPQDGFSANSKPNNNDRPKSNSGDSKSSGNENPPNQADNEEDPDRPDQSDSVDEKNNQSDSKTDEPESGDEDPEDPKSSQGKSGDSADSKSSEPEPTPSQAGDPNAGDSKAGDSKSSDSKSSDSKSGDSKSGDSKSGNSDSKSGEPKSGSQSSDQPPQPGQESLQKAADHQLKAEEKLSSGKAVEAKRQEQDALDNMQQALNELQKEKRRIESLPPEALEQMADEQRRTRDKAMELVEEMKEAPQAEEKEAGGENGEQPSSSPGQESMEQAGDSMQQAAQDLQQQNPQDAQDKQQKAEQQMQQALDEIEDRLNQLREETREEKLARLEARFQEMLQRQIASSVMTIELDDRRTSLNDLRRRDQLLLLQLSNEELEISEIAQQAYDLLLEDGTSVVFPEIVQELRQELAKAAQLLQTERTDQVTQIVQKEIEFTIQDLLDALKEAKGNEENGGGGGGGGGGENPLLKRSAELKILRMQQLRLNRRSKKIEQIRGTADLAPIIESETREAAEFQQKLIQMLEGVLENEGG